MTGVVELVVISTAFVMGGVIPATYTGIGKNISPPLSWTGIPEGTKSIAIVCDDPDAPMGTWVHWVLFNLPPDTARLDEGVPTKPRMKNGAIQGINDYQRNGYGGPMPPPGRAHRYFFKVYALDTMLSLDTKAVKADLEMAMEGHILANGQLSGTFKR